MDAATDPYTGDQLSLCLFTDPCFDGSRVSRSYRVHLQSKARWGNTPRAGQRGVRQFNGFPPEEIRVASGLFQSFATALTKRVDAQRIAAVLQ
jgi:hypothetical protein